MIESIIKYLSACPVFDGVRINANYLDGEVPSCSLESSGGELVVRRYADGGVLCEKRFILALRTEHTPALGRNLRVAGDCEKIERWLRTQADSGSLPQTSDGTVPCSLELVKGFGITHTASLDVRFEAELKYTFYSDGVRTM